MSALQTIASLLIKIGVDPSDVESGMAKAEASVERHHKAIGRVQKAAGVALAGGLALATKGAVQAEEAQARFMAETGASAEEAQHFAETVNAMSGSTTVAFDQIAESATKIRTDLGLVGADADKALDQFTRYEKATGQGADAVAAFDDIQDAWNLTAKDTQGIMDVLIASHQKYGGSIEGSQAALAELAPSLQAANMSWEQGAGLLNLFNAAGVDSAAATAGMQRALTKVKSPEELQKLLDDISATEDPFERATKAADLFGSRAGAKMGQVLGAAGGDIDQFTISVEEATGATTKANDALEGTFSAKLKLAINGVTSALRGLGMEFGPLLTGAASLGTLAEQLGLTGPLKKAGGKAARVFGGAFKAALSGGAGLLSKLTGPLTSAMSSLGEKMGGLFGGKFGAAFKGVAFLGLAAVLADQIGQAMEMANKNRAQADANDKAMADLLASGISGEEAQKRLDDLKRLRQETTGLQGDLMNFGDLAKGNILGSGMDFIFGANPAEDYDNQVRALEAYIASHPPKVGEAVAEGVKAEPTPPVTVKPPEVKVKGKLGTGALRKAVSEQASGISSAWDAVSNAFNKGPKIQSLASRMKKGRQALKHAMGQMRKAIKAGDPLAASYWADQYNNVEKAMGSMNKSANDTMTNVEQTLNRGRKRFRKTDRGISKDARRESRNRAKDAKEQSDKAAAAAPEALQAKVGATANAAEAQSNAVESAMAGLPAQAAMWGGHAGQMFAANLRAQQGNVAAAAGSLASTVHSFLGFSSPPKKGKLHDIDKWGEHMVVRWVRPIHKGRDKAKKAGERLAGGLHEGMGKGGGKRRSGGSSRARIADSRSSRGDRIVIQVGTLIANDKGIDELQRRMDRRLRLRKRRAAHGTTAGR